MAIGSGVEQAITPHLNKNERIQDSLVLKKVTCCFTNQRLFLIRRKQFGFRRYFIDVPYKDITGVEFFRTFNSIFFLYGVLLLISMVIQQANIALTLGLATATFVVVFFFKIHGMQLHHKDPSTAMRAEILGTKTELQKAVVMLRKYGVDVYGTDYLGSEGTTTSSTRTEGRTADTSAR